MNTKVLFLALSVVALSSCSTAYKMGQTPDDVYFSPAREQDEYVAVNDQEDRYYTPGRTSSPNRYEAYDDYNDFRNDRFLRMSIGSRYRSSIYDDFYWNGGFSGANSWRYNNLYGSTWNSPWNSYYYWNNFYNPYNSYNFIYPYAGYGYGGYNNVVIVNPKTPLNPVNNISRPRAFNPSAYTNTFNNNNRYLDRNAITNSRPSTNSSGARYNNRNGFSNGVRRVFSSPDNDSYYNNSNRSSRSGAINNTFTPSRSSSDAPVRTYTPSSSSSSSSSGSSSGSGGGGISRPTRGGN